MNTKPPETFHQENGNAVNHSGQPSHSSEHLHPDQELVYRLKSAIDQRGRNSFRLSNTAAWKTIEDRFHRQLVLSPQEYLDRHYDERRKQGTKIDRTCQRNRDQDRGRYFRKTPLNRNWLTMRCTLVTVGALW